MDKEELKKELVKFFDWYKKSPFSSSGRTEDLIDVYCGDWTPTSTFVVKYQVNPNNIILNTHTCNCLNSTYHKINDAMICANCNRPMSDLQF